jgi:hypothetical protein
METLHSQLVNAIQSVQTQIRWKPGSAVRHLLKRKLRGHLPPEAGLEDYEYIIQAVLTDSQAQVYVYYHNDVPYGVVVAVVQSRHWLVMFTLDEVIESAYVIEHPVPYLSKSVFKLIGFLSEVMA